MSRDLDALEVFVRVAELGSFTQAAQLGKAAWAEQAWDCWR